MRIRNKEFLSYVALFDTLTIRFVTNNPYAGQININWWDCIKPALYSYDETPVGTEIQAVIDCAKLRDIYGANPTELRLYFSAVDASSTSMYISIKDIKFAKPLRKPSLPLRCWEIAPWTIGFPLSII